jgi:uncharacterized protein (TIGR03084 family)
MITQADEFERECEELNALLEGLDVARFRMPTGFKAWTFDDVVGHLHFWNVAANLSLVDEPAYLDLVGQIKSRREAGATLREGEQMWLGEIGGHELLRAWREYAATLAANFRNADPAVRILWGGRRMSARSSITARLMETWSHAQAVYDLLGIERRNTDRILNIVVLGVNTYDWTFANRGLPLPEPRPYVEVTGPSGAVWTFNAPSETDFVKGSAEEFCQVVTQTRNIADTHLRVAGESATRWMANAQAFAGAPQTPPNPGARRMATA